MYKILGWAALIALFALSSCTPANGGASSDKAKIRNMVQTKVDSLTKELAADCDRRLATAVKAKANAAAFRANAKPSSSGSSSSSSGSATGGNTSTLPTTVKPSTKKGKLGGNLGKTGKVITGTGQKVKKTVNDNFDPAKRKKGKLGGKKN